MYDASSLPPPSQEDFDRVRKLLEAADKREGKVFIYKSGPETEDTFALRRVLRDPHAGARLWPDGSKRITIKSESLLEQLTRPDAGSHHTLDVAKSLQGIKAGAARPFPKPVRTGKKVDPSILISASDKQKEAQMKQALAKTQAHPKIAKQEPAPEKIDLESLSKEELWTSAYKLCEDTEKHLQVLEILKPLKENQQALEEIHTVKENLRKESKALNAEMIALEDQYQFYEKGTDDPAFAKSIESLRTAFGKTREAFERYKDVLKKYGH